MNSENSKKCNKCENDKNFSDFCFRNKAKNILHGTCKDCINSYASKYRDENKTLLSIKQKKWVKKYSKILNYLSVPLEYFKKWIEFQFQLDSKMTWENQGKYWDFDHVKPCDSFDLTNEEEIKKCFVWHNISPLEKKKNYSKNKKIDPLLIENTNKRKELFISLYPVPSLNSDI
jgi:hypothetical protein